MPKFGVGISDVLIAARPTAEAGSRINYLSAVGSRVDSYWVPDHLNALLPRSIWSAKYCGATKLVPKIDAYLEPWTMLGHLAARNRLAVSAWVRASRTAVGVTPRLQRRRLRRLTF